MKFFKKTTGDLLILIFLVTYSRLGFSQITTPQESPKAVVSQEIGLTKVVIEYSRPSLKGRTVFGNLVSYGKVWRTGANQITRFKNDDSVWIEGKLLPPGEYGLFTIPNVNEWIVIWSKDAYGWGAYNYNPENDVLRINVKSSKSADKTETFTIEFSDLSYTSGYFVLRWDNTLVRLRLDTKPDARIQKEIDNKINYQVKAETYYDAAEYYLNTNKDLKKALEWASLAAEKNPQFWTWMLKAKIALKMGDCNQAYSSAEKTLELAIKAGEETYIKNAKTIMEQCKGK